MKAHRGVLRRHGCGLAAALTLGVSGCGGGSHPSGAASTPIAPTPPTPTNRWSVAGQVVATGSPQGVAGATLTPAWSLAAVTADADGKYELADRTNPPTSPFALTVSEPGFIAHDVWISWQPGSRTNVTLDMIRDAPPFSMDFYRQFVRDMYDQSDGSPWPLQRWTTTPNFYVRTLDDASRAVEQNVVDATIDALRRGVAAFTAGYFSAGSIETGTDVRPEAADWINVEFKRHDPDQPCGTAFVGRNPGTITLWLDTCGCGSIRVSPSVAMHEIGHAMGFFHVSDPHSLMYPFDESGCRPGSLSPAEAFHAAIAYARPRLNADPDHDPSSFKTLTRTKAGPLVVN
ncbi:MAG TPA: matrixin family metalloprotease [Vicinamibacterales bacterium]